MSSDSWWAGGYVLSRDRSKQAWTHKHTHKGTLTHTGHKVWVHSVTTSDVHHEFIRFHHFRSSTITRRWKLCWVSFVFVLWWWKKTSNINKLNDLKVVSLSSQTVLYYSRNMETILTLHHQEGGDDDWASLSGWTLLILVRRVRTSLNPESRVIWFWSSFRCELTSGLESLRTWYCRNWCSM